MRSMILGVAIVAMVGCNNRNNVQCEQNANCDLSGGGMCIAGDTGMWCAYPDPGCPGGYRYSDQDVGGGVGGECVPAGPDAGIDAPADGTDASLSCPQGAPIQSGQAAELVLGQPGFTSSGPNNPFLSGSSLSTPVGILGDGTRLWISDSGNARMLQWNSSPNVNGQSANIALGQMDMLNASAGTTQQQFALGGGFVARAGSKLVVSDAGNNRVLIWNSIPTSSGQGADLVLGQPTFTAKANGNSASGLYGPTGVWTDGTHLIVADRFNNRVLIWNTFPTANAAPADVVLGAAAFGSTPFVDPPTAASFRNPYGVTFDGTHLFVADGGNNRVLVWSGIPTANNADAALVIGQSGFDSNFNNGGAPYPNVNGMGMKGPSGVIVDECGSLYICDDINGRVLVFTHVPAGNGAAADAVLGKPSITSQPNTSTAATDTWMNGCRGLTVSGNSLFVADGANNRVLRFSLAR